MKKHEDSIQRAVMTWARWQTLAPIGINGKLSHFIHHSPNGGYRSKSEGRNFKLLGTKAGFPDLFLFIPKGGYHGLFIELKTPKGKTKNGKTRQAGKVSDNQEMMIDRLNAVGYKAVVVYGANEAIDEIKAYLGINK
ncbi:MULTISPECIES: VRR-NUC domain-containing protein [unclassified Moraxella]|uniref:VRR-NUC domain-containing protein n=1 Tax=unclassified Moraxella TaxID=2685852 RepID=UPI00359CD1A4